MVEQRSAFYVGEKFLTYEEFADKLTIGYCSMVSRLTCLLTCNNRLLTSLRKTRPINKTINKSSGIQRFTSKGIQLKC